MSGQALALQTHFRDLKDPRRAPRHLLLDIIAIAVCAVICGASDWQQVVTFGQQRRWWLQRFLALPNGIPSHDTFARVFDRLRVGGNRCFRFRLRIKVLFSDLIEPGSKRRSPLCRG